MKKLTKLYVPYTLHKKGTPTEHITVDCVHACDTGVTGVLAFKYPHEKCPTFAFEFETPGRLVWGSEPLNSAPINGEKNHAFRISHITAEELVAAHTRIAAAMGPKKSEMWLSNVTLIDCAFYDEATDILMGDSIDYEFLVEGYLNDEKEQVVVDFSKVKKAIKEFMDDKYDHRLLLVPKKCYESEVRYKRVQRGDKSDITHTITPRFEVTMDTEEYQKSVRVFARDNKDELAGVCIDRIIKRELLQFLQKRWPNVTDIKLRRRIAINPCTMGEGHVRQPRVFDYVHGLANSTSFGCQNIMHGHRSFFQIFARETTRNVYLERATRLMDQIERAILLLVDGAYIVNRKYLEPNGTVGYESASRGAMSLNFKKTSKVAIIDDEPTIENIVSEIGKYVESLPEYAELKSMDIQLSRIVVTEGTWKGATYTFE